MRRSVDDSDGWSRPAALGALVLGFLAFVALPRVAERPEGLYGWVTWAFWSAILVAWLMFMVTGLVGYWRERRRR